MPVITDIQNKYIYIDFSCCSLSVVAKTERYCLFLTSNCYTGMRISIRSANQARIEINN